MKYERDNLYLGASGTSSAQGQTVEECRNNDPRYIPYNMNVGKETVKNMSLSLLGPPPAFIIII